MDNAMRDRVTKTVTEMLVREQLHRTCISCIQFDEQEELCLLFNMRPPARVIATACAKYSEKPPF